VLGEMSKNASYDAAVGHRLGVEVLEVGGKKRCSSIAILRKLGYDNELIALLLKRGVIEQEAEEFSASDEAA
jgi:predicted subunit of tRNA(5-methylaminomethyl-2-thiouridylate) methyltransferase